jgi:hypothetical protein
MDVIWALWLGLQVPALPAQTAEPAHASVVSLERVRRGLEEPPATLTILSSDPNLPPVFRLEVRERPLAVENLWKRDWVPPYVQPSRTYYHQEFLASVTPDLFRSTAMYPCCDVGPLLRLFKKTGARKATETKARREVKQAHAEFLATLKTTTAKDTAKKDGAGKDDRPD